MRVKGKGRQAGLVFMEIVTRESANCNFLGNWEPPSGSETSLVIRAPFCHHHPPATLELQFNGYASSAWSSESLGDAHLLPEHDTIVKCGSADAT